nr:hypothetical protein [uncultured Oscillibacter sp.]
MYTRFNPKSLKVREQAAAGDYLAVLLSDREGEWCMSFWQRDEEYPERFRVTGGRCRIEPGAWGLMERNFGTREQPVLAASGVELPEEAETYEWGGDAYRLRSWVDPDLRTALDIFIMALPMSQEQPSVHVVIGPLFAALELEQAGGPAEEDIALVCGINLDFLFRFFHFVTHIECSFLGSCP